MSYEKQNWIDHIEDIETGEVFQEGTLFTAKRMNHIEEGIYQASSQIKETKKLIGDRININLFPKLDGELDDTGRFERAIDYIRENKNVSVLELNGESYTISKTILL